MRVRTSRPSWSVPNGYVRDGDSSFVAGATARSTQAVLRVRQLCEAELRANCTLEVIDIYQQPALARKHQIVATPTLIKELPRPMRRFIGNLLNTGGLFDEVALNAKDSIAV